MWNSLSGGIFVFSLNLIWVLGGPLIREIKEKKLDWGYATGLYMDFVSLVKEQGKDQTFSIGNYFLYTAIFLAHWSPLQASSTALLGFAMLRYVIGSKLSRHFFIQLEIKPNPVATVKVFPRFTHVTVYTVGGWTQLGERGNDPFLQRRSIKNNTLTNFKKA